MIARAVAGSVVLLSGWVLYATRVFQVSTFLAAAAIRSRMKPKADRGPASQSQAWSAAESIAPIPTPVFNERALVTYHPEYHNHSPMMAVSSLKSAAEMGFGWVRTDLRWNRILPDGSEPDAGALHWYRRFLEVSRAMGLKNMVVLTTPPKLKDGQVEWRRFVEVVVKELGQHCDAYQLFNEPNNPVYRIFDLDGTSEGVTSAATIIRNTDPKPTLVNIATDLWGWRSYAEGLLAQCEGSIDVFGFDRYPGTWTVGFDQSWKDLIQIADATTGRNQTVWSNRRIAILETGYSTNLRARSEEEQNAFFIRLFNSVRERGVGEVLAYFGIYELVDGETSAGMDPEAHFGLMTTDLKPKIAVETVKRFLSTY
jgi:Glycosyl hydrolase family 1